MKIYETPGGYYKIKLDDDVYDYVIDNNIRIYVNKDRGKYACMMYDGLKFKSLKKYIMGLETNKYRVVEKNKPFENIIDQTRDNLYVISYGDMQRKSPPKNGLKFKGPAKWKYTVTDYYGNVEQRERIHCNLCIESRYITMGSCKTIEESARLFDSCIVFLYGSDVWTNFGTVAPLTNEQKKKLKYMLTKHKIIDRFNVKWE